MTKKLDSRLMANDAFDEAIKKLVDKQRDLKDGLYRSPVVRDLNLNWILQNRHELTVKIQKCILSEDFEFSLLKKIKLQTNEKIREIFISNYADRILLMTLQNIVSETTEKSHCEHLFSFRKGHGPASAAKKLSYFLKSQDSKKGPMYFLGRDITSYGDHIVHEKMDAILDETVELNENPLILKLLKKSYRVEYFNENEKDIRASLIKGIPSGSPIVPILENLYLRELDKKLMSLNNSFYARYGDDFIFLSPSKEMVRQAEAIIETTMNHLGLSISEKKRKNIVLGIKRDEERFKSKDFFEWIGMTFYQNGTFSFKPKHQKQFKQKTREEIGNFTFYLSRSGMTTNEIRQCLAQANNDLTNISHSPEVQKIIVLRTHIPNTKKLDRASRDFLLRSLCKALKITKKEAWKIIRQIKLNSLEYQRRKLKCNRVA